MQAKKVDKEPNLLDNNILRGCEPDDIKSLNGCRVTDKINELVNAAGPKSIENFQTTLKCVKRWAKNRGVYSNVLGYPGGVAWALMVAKVCINHPKLETNQLLPVFFKYFRDYNWSFDNPVTLEEPIANDPNIIGFQLPDDGKLFYKQMHQHKMPIITPAFPAQNATHNISESTKKVILTELEKACLVTSALIQSPEDPTLSWARLFKKFPFFKAYEHFIEIQVLSKTEADHGKWGGFCQSKIKNLLQRLEIADKHLNSESFDFRPWTNSYRLPDEHFEVCEAFYIGVRIKGGKNVRSHVDLSETRSLFFDMVHELLVFNQTVKDLLHEESRPIDMRVCYKARGELPDEVRPVNFGTKRLAPEEPQLVIEMVETPSKRVKRD